MLLLFIYYLIYNKFFNNNKNIIININNNEEKEEEEKDLSYDDINNDYNITNLYKLILNREPTDIELVNAKNISLTELKNNLINSPEYDDIYNKEFDKVINNNIVNDIYHIYKEELKNNKIPIEMIIPLKDCFIYFKYDKNLYRAFLNDPNFEKFQNEIINLKYKLTKKLLLIIFNKYFNLYELKLKANDVIKFRKMNNLDNNDDINPSNDNELIYDIKNDKDDLTFTNNHELITDESH